MRIDPLHPDGWAPARGYSNGILVRGSSALLFVAGQIAWDAEQRLVGRDDFVLQFRTALETCVLWSRPVVERPGTSRG